MKRANYVHHYSRPENYYNRLFTFFVLISISLTLSLVGFHIKNIDVFLIKFVIVFFLLLTIASLIEYLHKSEYLSPLEIYDLQQFFDEFCYKAHKNTSLVKKYMNTYDSQSKKNLNILFGHEINYVVSTIKKHEGVYEITFISEKHMLGFYVLRMLFKPKFHKLYLKKENMKLKVIGLK